jgi:hypothetical protein
MELRLKAEPHTSSKALLAEVLEEVPGVRLNLDNFSYRYAAPMRRRLGIVAPTGRPRKEAPRAA